MALNVESVLDGGMDGQEALSGSGRFETLHLARAPSCWLVRILSPIVLAQALLMASGQSNFGLCRAERLIAEGDTAALAFDDSVTQGIVAGLAERTVAVPGDIGVVGCDGVIASTTFPALTSIDAHCNVAGGRAVDLPLNLMRDFFATGQRITRRAEFVVRASTSVAPGNAGLRDVVCRRGARVAVSERPL